MGITFIYSVKMTGNNSLNYDTENKIMKIEKKEEIQNEDSIKSLNYIMKDKKGNVYNLSSEYLSKMKDYITYDENKNITFSTITSSLNCSVENAYSQWQNVRNLMNTKNGNKGNLQYCIVQNFGTDIDPAIANEIGLEFAKRYLNDYQVVISTHINTGLVHNHIEFNATSFVNGKKFNDCLNTIGEIRNISDTLCREYGLEVLEETKDFNYIFYKDENGNLKTFEPTERKMNKKENEFSNKNDYRNTQTFDNGMKSKKNHVEILQEDIEKFILHSNSYDELLNNLENIGYTISSKTKKGEWRKHISFKLDDWGNSVRDTSLDEKYHRLNLTIFFEEKEKDIRQVNENVHISDVEDFSKSDIYVYGRIVIDDIDEEYRYRKENKTQIYSKIKRNDLEKLIIKDTKQKNKTIDEIVKKSLFVSKNHTDQITSNKKKQYLINQINNNLHTLRFIEEKNIHSVKQITDTINSLYDKRNSCYGQVKVISKGLKLMNQDISLIDNYNNLKAQIEINLNNKNYLNSEKEIDVATLKEMENILKDKNLILKEKQNLYREKYKEYKQRFSYLTLSMEKISNVISEYDRAVKNINEVDKEYDNNYSKQINDYYDKKNEYENRR